MRFHEDDCDEERDERESKTYRVIRGCFKGVLYGASALVWILVLITVFNTRESKLLSRMYFTDATKSVAEATEDYRVYQLHVQDFMNQGGSITVANIWYAPESGELELGVKYNKKLTDGSTDDPILYVLKDNNGKEYPIVGYHEDAIGRYGYARVCFGEVSLPLEQEKTDMTLTLTLSRKSDGALLSTYINEEHDLVNNAEFTIYSRETIVQSTEYDD